MLKELAAIGVHEKRPEFYSHPALNCISASRLHVNVFPALREKLRGLRIDGPADIRTFRLHSGV